MKLLKLVPDNTNIDFMRWRNLALVLSILATVASLVLVGVKGLNLGVDFVGGQMVRVTFAQQIDVEQLRGDVGSLNVGEGSIQETGGPRSYQIRLPEAGRRRSGRESRRLPGPRRCSSSAIPAHASTPSRRCPARSARSSPGTAGLAITLAMLGIAVYIWFRFEWQFGVGALLTLFHDVSMIFGFFALTQLQVDLNIVAAFLAIVGYSLNDTVVIYDRIRENLRKYRKMAIVPLLNLSLNETLSRTMVTSLSILLALGMLVLFGPDVIFGLTIAIFLGIFDRHLFLDLHLLAGAGLAGGQARQLPAHRR